MTYKPTGQIIGNTDKGQVDSDAPSNKAPYLPAANPDGTKAIAFGEDALSQAVNRLTGALGRNVDSLSSDVYDSIAVPTLFQFLFAGGSEINMTTPGGTLWIYHGLDLADAPELFRLMDSDGLQLLDGGGTPITVTDVLETSGGASTYGTGGKLLNATNILQPGDVTQTHPRHRLLLTQSIFTALGAGWSGVSMNGLRVWINGSVSGNADGTNDGFYKIRQGLTDDTEVVLYEYRHRIRHGAVAAGPFAAADVITGGTSGATATIAAAADIGADHLEFDSVDGVFEPGETVTGAPSGASATVVRFSETGDPVLLNNRMTNGGVCSIFTDDLFQRPVFLSLSAAAPAGAVQLVCGARKSVGTGMTDDFLRALTDPTANPSGTLSELIRHHTLDAAYRSSSGGASGAGSAGDGRILAATHGPVHVHGDIVNVRRYLISVTSGNGFESGENVREDNGAGALIGDVLIASKSSVVLVVSGATPVSTDVIYGETSATTATVTTIAQRDYKAQPAMVMEAADQFQEVAQDTTALGLTDSRPGMLEILVPVYTALVPKIGIAATYTNASNRFTAAGLNLYAFGDTPGDAQYLRWPEIVVQVYDALDPSIEGYYAPTYDVADTDAVLLSSIGAGTALATGGLPAGARTCKLRWFARAVYTRGYDTAGLSRQLSLSVPSRGVGADLDYSTYGLIVEVKDPHTIGSALILSGTETAIWQGNNGTSSAALFVAGLSLGEDPFVPGTFSHGWVAHMNPTGSADGLRILGSSPLEADRTYFEVRQAAGPTLIKTHTDVATPGSAVDPDFTEIPVVYSDTIRSNTNKTAAASTASISLATASAVVFRSSLGASELEIGQFLRESLSANALIVQAPGGAGALGVGDATALKFATDLQLTARNVGGDKRLYAGGQAAGSGAAFEARTDGGLQNREDGAGLLPYLRVADICYGADFNYTDYAGKVANYQTPITMGRELLLAAGAGALYLVGGANVITGLRKDAAVATAYALFPLPPFCRGADAEFGGGGSSPTRFFSEVNALLMAVDGGAGDQSSLTLRLLGSWRAASTGVLRKLSDAYIPTLGGAGVATAASITPKHEGVCSGAAAILTEIALAAGADDVDDTYETWQVVIRVSGVGPPVGPPVGETRTVTSYDGATHVATVNPAWSALPQADTEYTLVPQTIGRYTSGQVAGSAATTLDLAGADDRQANFYNGRLIRILDGVAAGDSRTIVGYDTVANQVTVDVAWSVNPGVGDLYEILGAEISNDEAYEQLFLQVDYRNTVNGAYVIDVNSKVRNMQLNASI